MATLKIGRISLPCDPESLKLTPRPDGRGITMSGGFAGTALAETLALQDELEATLQQTLETIPVTWDGDGTHDGFYEPKGGNVPLKSMAGNGYVEFSCDLRWRGDDNTVRFCSLITGDVIANDHSYTGSGAGYVGPPTGRYAYSPAATSTVLRKGEDGNIRTFLAVASGANPEWHVAPADFYKNACEITVNGYLRAGLTAENDPTDWLLSNGLVKVAPTTDGALIVSHYDGVDWRATTWAVLCDSTAVGNWGAVGILTNRPERVSIRLIQERTATQGVLTLDLAVRRGSRILEGIFYSDIATEALTLDTDSAGTTGATPTGTMKKTDADGNGHRWMIGSELTTTLTVATGTMTKTAARLPFMIAKEVDEGGGVQSGDTDDDLWDQYMAWRSERVRAVAA
jgi:hypothetical protein